MEQAVILPIKGMDMDTEPSLLSNEKARYIKNGQVLINKGTTGNGSNQLALTPIQSNIRDFPREILPKLYDYTIDLTALSTQLPTRVFSYLRDYAEIFTDVLITNQADLNNYMASLGFQVVSPFVYKKTQTHNIWQKILFNKELNQIYDFVQSNEGSFYGTNFTIGSYYDIKLNQMYWFNYNTNARHHILMYDANNQTYTKLFETPFLNFDYDYPIHSVDLVEVNVSDEEDNVKTTSRLLYWTDGINPPRKINVDKCISGEYWNTLPLWYRTPDEWMRAVKYPPKDRTKNILAKDSTVPYNYIAYKSFQFRYRYIYDDGEFSVYSPISTLTYPNDSFTTDFTLLENLIRLKDIYLGSHIVSKVEICYRLGNTGDFRSFITLTKEDIIANYNYDYTKNTFEYNFYNNQTYALVPPIVSNKLYDKHPLAAHAQELLTNNTLAYGNILEDYSNLTDEQRGTPTIDVIYEDIQDIKINLSVEWRVDFPNFPEVGGFDFVIYRYNAQSNTTTQIFNTNCIITNGDYYFFNINNVQLQYQDKLYCQVENVFKSGGILNIYDCIFSGTVINVANPQPCGNGNFIVQQSAPQSLTNGVSEIVKLDNATTNQCDTWDETTYKYTNPYNNIKQAQLKQGGLYSFGFICYDEALRSTYVQTSKQLDVYINTIMESGGYKNVSLVWNWNNLVLPNWVKYVSICRTKNKRINRNNNTGYLQTTMVGCTYMDINNNTLGVTSANGVKLKFDISIQTLFNTNNYQRTTTTYTYTEGDIIRILTKNGTNLRDNIVEKPLQSLDGVNFYITVDNSIRDIGSVEICEIYTPPIEDTTDIYYEVSDLIPTTGVLNNNKVSQTTTAIDTFDTYGITRGYLTSSGFIFEHHSRSDLIQFTNNEDIGRINVVNPNAKQTWKPTLVRFSFAYNPESFINGLSTFDSDRDKTYYRNYGAISKLICVKTELYVIQHDNVFKSSINKSQVQYADGTVALIAANQIISDPFDTVGDYGCQDAATIVEKDGIVYFWDVKRGAVVMFDGKQQTPISKVGMDSYIQLVSKYILKNAGSGLYSIKVRGGYDPKYNSYMLTGFKYDPNNANFSHIDNTDEPRLDGIFTLAWDMNNGYWKTFYGYIPEYYSYVSGDKDGIMLITFRYGVPYLHNKDSINTYNTFYGNTVNQVLEVSFNKFPQVVKNYVTMGYDSDDAYDVVNVSTSTDQTSKIPIVSFVNKEGNWWSNFYRDMSKGGTLANGNQLKGNFALVRLIKDYAKVDKYNELRRIFYNFTTSQKTLR
jgi:hypothetical protein